MTDNEKSLVEALAKALNIATEGMATLFNEAGELQSIDPFISELENRNRKAKADRDNQYSRGKAEALKSLEKELKVKYGVTDEVQGIDLVDSIVIAETEKVKDASPDDIDKHPQFALKQREWQKQMAAKEQEFATKIDELTKAHEQDKLMGKVEQKAVEFLMSGYNPALPENQTRAEKLRQMFIADIRSGKYKIDGDAIIPVDETGEQLTDNTGKPITFDLHAENYAALYFDKAAPGSKKTAPGGNEKTPGKHLTVPKNESEFAEMSKSMSPQERAELLKAYRENQQ